MDHVSKLEGLPGIYYINLQRSNQRREYMELQFKGLGIVNYERIDGVDGRDEEYVREALVGDFPLKMDFKEVACVMSHLKVMKSWIEKCDEDVLMVMEDDCDMSTVNFWGFCWHDFVRRLPFHWDVVQLCLINPTDLTMGLHAHFVNDFSCTCYMIRRSHAQKLVNAHCWGDRYRLDQNIRPSAVADDLIYKSGFALAISIFGYKIDMESTIHPSHHALHKENYDAMWRFWRQKAGAIQDWSDFLSYNPYYGNLPPRTVAKFALMAAKKAASSSSTP
uniref:glycosyltransferase family 25 protein n=1 Tax=Synechococcus sp. UW106 TaxID=368495 RepID=UPI000E0E0CF0|nr:glycosyltransferase family 25 protein [Synechococcus sp. UW106]